MKRTDKKHYFIFSFYKRGTQYTFDDNIVRCLSKYSFLDGVTLIFFD